MKYAFCITICGEIDTDVTPIPPPDGGSPPYIDNRPPSTPIIDAGFPTTPPGGRPQWPVDPGYGIEVPPGQEGGPPQIDNTLPEGNPYPDAGFPTTPPGGRPQPPVEPPEEGGPPVIDNSPPQIPIIDAGFPTTPPGGRPQWPVDPNYGIDICDPGPQRILKALATVVTIKKTRGVRVETFKTEIDAMTSKRRKD
jgi:hypothetical protein